LLLENIEPGSKVSDEPQVPPAHEGTELLTGLRETAEHDAGQLPTLAQGMEPRFSRIGRLLSNPRVGALVARQVLDDGADLSQPSPLHTATRLDVSSVWDESNARTPDGRIVCKPATGVLPEQVRDQLTTVYGVYTTIYVALPRSLPATIRQWVQTNQAEDLAASLTALETAIRDQPNPR
jgi:hypothetical protein